MSTLYLHLQNTMSGTTVDANAMFQFNSVKIKSDGIEYMVDTGTAYLSKPGTYLVQWSVSATSAGPIQIGISTSTPQGTIIGDSTNFPGQLSGSAVVIVPENSTATLRLQNNSPAPLLLTNMPVAVNLLVYAYIPENAGDGKTKLVLPFSSGYGPTCYPHLNKDGVLTEASIIGCGQSSNVPINLNVSGGTIIQVPFAADRSQYLFSFPYNVRLVAASAIFNNFSAISLSMPSTIISPFVSIAKQAVPNTYTFDIIEESKVYSTKGYQSLNGSLGGIPSSTILTAVKTDLNVPVPAGMPFAIAGGLINLGLSRQELLAFIYMHGSMIFEIEG